MKPDQAHVVGLSGGSVDSALEDRIRQFRGGGQPLDGGVRASMEGAFQADFSRVRIHHNRQSDSLNRKLSARAFTTGQDLFFKNGEYNPHTTSGQTLLAHELTHVVQQNGAAVRRKPNKEVRRAYAGPIRTTSGGDLAQRVTWDYASLDRERWKKQNTAAKVALAPLGGVYGAARGGAQGYRVSTRPCAALKVRTPAACGSSAQALAVLSSARWRCPLLRVGER
jgi:hypothetical protein